MKDELRKLIGKLPSDSHFKKRMRFHQGWWRTFVLAEESGLHPIRKDETVCSAILDGQTSRKNFLSPKISNVVNEAIQARQIIGSGILEEDRLFNNLLSSQPLCFNFFGELRLDTAFALQVLQRFYPEFTQVRQVVFEFAPEENWTNDNSAFDVAFEVMSGDQKGLLGLECKYTDTFSPKEYGKNKKEYRQIFDKGSDTTFAATYEEFTTARFNQLFRNQLIAESLLQNGKYDFALTGLFCHQEDEGAQKIGAEFQRMLKKGATKFRVITYREFIETIQLLDISWERRELSMLLWARYCGTQLSKEVFD